MKKILTLALAACMLLGAAASAETYTASAKGLNGDVTVSVSVEDGAVTTIDVTESAETAGLGDVAMEKIIEKIIAGQTLAVDSIAGATFSSKAVLTAVEACLVQAGLDVDAMKTAAETAEIEKTAETKDTDVLVVGGGISGLAAAMTAADAGAKVILIDKMPAVGGTTAISGGFLISLGSELYKTDAYEHDNLADFKVYWQERMAYSGAESGYPDWDRLESVLADTGKTVDYLAENGITWGEHVFTGFGPYPVASNTARGAGLIAQMLSAAEAKGVTVMTECKAESLIVNGGKVVGAMAQTADKVITFNAKSTVLCTGGISRNEELVAQYSPKVAAAGTVPTSAVSNTGDGFLLALEAGAGTFDTFATAICATTVDPALSAVTDASVLTTAAQLGINAKGERFASESPKYTDALGSDMIQNQNAPYWYIYDATNADITAVLEAGAQAGVVAKGETIEALAAAMGVDSAALSATYAQYMDYVTAGTDEQFAKSADLLVALDQAPFYAVKFYPTTFGSVGGIMTTEEGRVQRQNGTVLEGLYAAGEMSNRYYYNENYILAASLGLYSTMGCRAGNAAAADALN